MTEKEFKNKLAAGIKEVSEAMSSDMEPMNLEVPVKMTDAIYRQIVYAKFPIEIEIYNQAFKSILNGEIQFYKLNIINLMCAFRIKATKPKINTPKEWLE